MTILSHIRSLRSVAPGRPKALTLVPNFKREFDALGRVLGKCLKCRKRYVWNTSRIKEHARQCSVVAVPCETEDGSSDDTPGPASMGSAASVGSQSTDGTPQVRRTKQPTLFAIRTTADEKRAINKAILQFVIGANVPFNTVAHPTFIDLLNLLRPGLSCAKVVVTSSSSSSVSQAFDHCALAQCGAPCWTRLSRKSGPSCGYKCRVNGAA